MVLLAGEYYVSTVLLDNQGRIARKVRKILVRSKREDGNAIRGSFRDVIDTLDAGGLRVGILSGDEIQVGIPRLANRGAETILIAAGWNATESKIWEARAAALGKEYDVNLIVANRQALDSEATGTMFLPRSKEAVLGLTKEPGMLIGSLSRRRPEWVIPSAAGLPGTVPTPYYERPNAATAELGRRLSSTRICPVRVRSLALRATIRHGRLRMARRKAWVFMTAPRSAMFPLFSTSLSGRCCSGMGTRRR